MLGFAPSTLLAAQMVPYRNTERNTLIMHSKPMISLCIDAQWCTGA